jgi:hypothetical protein
MMIAPTVQAHPGLQLSVTLLQKPFTAENAERAKREKCKIRTDLVFSLPNPQKMYWSMKA